MKDDKRYAKYYDQSLKKSVDGGVSVDAVLDRIEKRGENRGVILSAQVYKAVQSGQQDNKVIAAKCGCTLGQVEKIRKEFGI